MGSKPLIAFLSPIRPLLKSLGLISALTLIGGCISDGPNQTGGQYLENQDIRFQNPLYHIVLPEFPVDSVWTIDQDYIRTTDSILILGASGDFEGRVRLAFDMADTNFLDSLRKDSADFRLSMGPYLSTGAGMKDLIASVGDTNAAPSELLPDSFTVLVESWAIGDTDDSGIVLTKAQRNDTLNRYNSRFMIKQDPTALLGKQSALDTIRMQLKGAYVKNNLQARRLPNLHKVLKNLAGSPKVLVHLQLTGLPDSNSKTMGLLRLDNRYGASINSGTHHGPALLFGSSKTTAITATTSQRLTPINTNGLIWGNSKLTYSGPATDLIPARQRSLHLILNRNKLRDSIDAFLKKSGITPPEPAITGKFDITYFVPFAKIIIPVDTTKIQGQFPMTYYFRSDLDSILPEAPSTLLRAKSIALNKPSVLLNVYSRTEPTKVVDTVSILFQQNRRSPIDSNIFQVIIRHNSDSARNDSTFITLDESKEKTISYTQGYPSLRLSMVASKTKSQKSEDTELLVTYSLSMPGKTETNAFRDPKTGKLLTEISDQVSQANQSLWDGITSRATHGLQLLLNRADTEKSVVPEFVLETGQSIDTAAVIDGKTGPQYIPYPVLNVIPPKLTGSKLSVGLNFYLYPLKKEP